MPTKPFLMHISATDIAASSATRILCAALGLVCRPCPGSSCWSWWPEETSSRSWGRPDPGWWDTQLCQTGSCPPHIDVYIVRLFISQHDFSFEVVANSCSFTHHKDTFGISIHFSVCVLTWWSLLRDSFSSCSLAAKCSPLFTNYLLLDYEQLVYLF